MFYKRLFSAVAAVCAVALMSFTLLAPPLQPGDKAPDFSLKNVDGKMVSLKNYKNAKGFIVVFTCNTCPYAVAYEDRIVALHKKYAKKGYPVVAINPNDPEVKPGDNFDAMKQRAKDKKFEFAYLLDAQQTVYPKYGATRTPEIFLLDKKMTVLYTGAIDDNFDDPTAVKEKYLEAAINAALKGNKPAVTTTKAVGCSIKTKKKS